MPRFAFLAAIACLAALISGSACCAPLAPDALYLSDSATWNGAPYRDSVLPGYSRHPFFALRFTASAPGYPATALRVQVALDDAFANLLWDSGFATIAATNPEQMTPGLAYGGTTLSAGTTYYWRAAVKDDHAVVSAFSTAARFSVQEALGACDLRVAFGSAWIQGNPATVADLPGFSAELVPAGTACRVQVETSSTTDFNEPDWRSDWIGINEISGGVRCPSIPYQGEELKGGSYLFWRMRFAPETGDPYAWSTCAASFLYDPSVPLTSAAAGFSRQARSFGAAENQDSDLFAAYINDNNKPDLVVPSRQLGQSHAIYFDSTATSPGDVVYFGSGDGTPARVACADFDRSGTIDIALVSSAQCVIYYQVDGEFVAGSDMGLDENGDLVSISANDADWDGWPDLLLCYEHDLIWLYLIEGELQSSLTVYTSENVLNQAGLEDIMYDGQPEIVVLADGYLTVFGAIVFNGLPVVAQYDQWTFTGTTAYAIADTGSAGARDIYGVKLDRVDKYALNFANIGSYWVSTKYGMLEHGGHCHQLLPSDLNGDGDQDLVSLGSAGNLALLQTAGGFSEHEQVGYLPDGLCARGATTDIDGDNMPDIVVMRPGATHTVFFNRARLSVNISNATATHPQYSDGTIAFLVELDAPPTSIVEVMCLTVEDEGGEGDGDGILDSSGIASGQLGGLYHYTPTSAKLIFVPGQTRQFFYVRLPAAQVTSAYTFTVQISWALGAVISQASATGSVYGAGSTSSGPPAVPGMARDWKLRGEVRAMARANGITFFGGSFDGVEWDAEGVATTDARGNQCQALAALSGDIRAVAADNDGSLYIGGVFTVMAGGQQFRNIVRLNAAGDIDTAFRPNPNGPVNAIDINLLYGVVYFGGKFTALESYPGTVFKNVAQVRRTGATASTDKPNLFGVYRTPVPPPPQTAEVLCLKFATSGYVGDYYLIVGGRYFDHAATTTTGSVTAQNLALFKIGGQAVVNMPRVNGEVRALAVSTQTFGYGSRAILFGGHFTTVFYPKDPWSPAAGPANLNSTNFAGEKDYSAKSPVYTPVNALLIRNGNQLWIGRNASDMGLTADPLAVFIVAGGAFTNQNMPASGLNGAVRSLALGVDEVLAGGDFTQCGSTGHTVPLRRLAAFSTTPLGVFKPDFRGGVLQGSSSFMLITAVASVLDAAGAWQGYTFAGSFKTLVAERGNLAAMDTAGHLLAWGPRVDGVVNAMIADSQNVYFGGDFTKVVGTITSTRRSLASASTTTNAQNATSWTANLSGATSTVHALAFTNISTTYYVVVGGDFTQIGSDSREDAAAIPAAGGSAHSWNASITTGGKVYAIHIDGARIYLGGTFSGAQTVTRPALVAVGSLTSGSPGTLENWNAAMPSGSIVWGLSGSTNDLFVAGNFTSLGGQSRARVGAVSKSNATATSFTPAVNDDVLCLAALAGGTVYIGGEFTSITPAGGSATTRKGAAVLDSQGALLGWDGSVLGTSTSDAVKALLLDDSISDGVIWVGGRFTGPAYVGQHNITYFSRAWHIVTSSLPSAIAGQNYPQTTIMLNESMSCSWSISAPAATWLQINSSTGVVDSNGAVPGTGPLQIPVLITATKTGQPSVQASRWFVINYVPPPPPTVLSISGPSGANEGEGPTILPAPELTVSLNQAFGTDVRVGILYIDGTARRGFDFAATVVEVTVLAGHTTAVLPLCIFGDAILTQPQQRSFTVKIVSLTQNVIVSVTNGQHDFTISEDDPPVAQHAAVRQIMLRESATQPADASHVISNTPYFAWVFGSDYVSETQASWQAQVSTSASFSSLLWDSGQQTGNASQIQLGALGGSATLSNGRDYFVRIRVWSTGSSTASVWEVKAFHTNTPPTAVSQSSLAPATATSSTPLLSWEAAPDADGDKLNFTVHLDNAVTTPHVIDSIVSPHLFEYRQTAGGSWLPFPQSGVAGPIYSARVKVPPAKALDATPPAWIWSVDVADAWESTACTGTASLNVTPAYVIEGTLLDASGGFDVGRTVAIELASAPGVIVSVATQTGGAFSLLVPASLSVSDTLVVFIQNSGATGSAFAAAYFRFPGGDMNQAGGPMRKLELRHNQVSIDARGQASLNLGDVVPAATPNQDLPFTVSPAGMSLLLPYTSIQCFDALEIRGTQAGPSEPQSLALVSGCDLELSSGATLHVLEGGTLDCCAISGTGALQVRSGATMHLRTDATLGGEVLLDNGATLHLHSANLTLSGTASVRAASVKGVNGGELLVLTGACSLESAIFDCSTLELGASAQVGSARSLKFQGGSISRRLHWKTVASTTTELQGALFESGATYNVYADAAATPLILRGCGGDGAGETLDLDPAEPTGNIVTWELVSIGELRGHAGDQRALLLWDAGEQSGSGIQFEVFAATSSGGTFSSLGTTSNTWFIESSLTNSVPRYYKVRIAAWGQSSDTEVLMVVPVEPTIESAFPMTVRQDGVAPGIVNGSDTNFSDSTTVSSQASGVSIPTSSIICLSHDLLLFDVETSSAALGSVTIEIETADVWSEHGVTGYAEQLSFQCEVKEPPSNNYPMVEFTTNGGAVDENESTSGAFSVAVTFDNMTGAGINSETFECILDRDIVIGGTSGPQTITAGTNLCDAQYGLWSSITTSGAAWVVEQLQNSTDPEEEFITQGEIVMSVRITNEFGFSSQWTQRRIFIEGNASDHAFVVGEIVQGEVGQEITVSGSGLTATTEDGVSVEFDDSEIKVTDIDWHQSGGSSYGTPRYWDDGTPVRMTPTVWLTVTISVSDNASGVRGYVTIKEGATDIARGSYRVIRKDGISLSSSGKPGPRAAVGAANVVLQNGDFVWGASDIGTQSNVFPIVWSRTYRSSRSGYYGSMGLGWFGTYTQCVYIQTSGGNRIPHWLDGQGNEIVFPGQATAQGEQEWTSPGGVACQLKTWNYETLASIQTEDGHILRFVHCPGDANVPTNYSKLRLYAIQDTNGNNQNLVYDSNGNLTTVFEPAGANEWCECLTIDYVSCRISAIQRRRAHCTTGLNNTPGTLYVAASQPVLSEIKYWYAGKKLALQEQALNDRHGRLFNAYLYESADNDGRLTSIVPPSGATVSISGNPVLTTSQPSLTNAYTLDAGSGEHRVTEQWIGPTSDRHYVLAYDDQPVSPPLTGLKQRTVTAPEGGVTTYWIDSNGQVWQSELGGCITKHEYDPFHALIKTVYPKGNSTVYMYARTSETGGGSAAYDSYSPSTNQTKFTISFSTPISPPTLVPGMLILIEMSNGVSRHFITESGTGGTTVWVYGKFTPSSTWNGQATFRLFDDQTCNPLVRFKVSQISQCATDAPGPDDLITTYVHADGKWFGQYSARTPVVIDPRGNVTKTQAPNSDHTAPADRPQWSVTTRYANGSESIVTVDPRGRVMREESTGSGEGSGHVVKKAYTYHTSAGSIYPATAGLLEKIVVSDGSGPVTDAQYEPSMTTLFFYDGLGRVIKQTPPHEAGVSGDDASTLCEYNSTGQLYRTRTPVIGTQGRRGETWYYYNKDGRIEREITLFVPVDATSVPSVTGGTHNLLTAAEIVAAFRRPVPGPDEAGWIHTEHGYNDYGEPNIVRRDLAAGPLVTQGGQTTQSVSQAETIFGYDKDGRLVLQWGPVDEKTVNTYDARGLVTKVTRQPGAGIESFKTFTYDANGNMTSETDEETQALTVYTHDDFDRLALVSHAGGLAEATIYPKPSEPNIVWNLSGPLIGYGVAWKRGGWSSLDNMNREVSSGQIATDSKGQPLADSNSKDGWPTNTIARTLDLTGLPINEFAVGSSYMRRLQHNKYSPFGQLLAQGESGVAGPKFYYDAAGRQKKTESPYVSWQGNNPTIKYTKTTAAFDPAGNPISSTEVTGTSGDAVSTVEVNSIGLPELSTDGAGRATKTLYDLGGRVVRTIVKDGTGDKTQTDHVYDASGRVKQESVWRHLSTQGAGSGDTQVTSYDYDAKGRLIKTTRPGHGVWTYKYDKSDRLTETHCPDDTLIKQVYNAAGDVEIRTITGPAPAVESYTYNEFHEIRTAQNSENGVTVCKQEFTYNSLGLIEEQTMEVYDASGNLVNVTASPHGHSAAVLGFTSLYETSAPGQNDWRMKASYDCFGRELTQTFWDGRVVKTFYPTGLLEGMSPSHVKDVTSNWELLTYTYEDGLLAARNTTNYAQQYSSHHYSSRASRPSLPFKPDPVVWVVTGAGTRFDFDERGGLFSVEHRHCSGSEERVFAGVQMRFDHSGNPIIERKLHQAGLSRLMSYDFAGRLNTSSRGFVFNLKGDVALPEVNLPATSTWVSAADSNDLRRGYTQDSVDNVTSVSDTVTSTRATQGLAIAADARNVIDTVSVTGVGTSGQFIYSGLGSIEFDPTTNLTNEYNWRGQLVKVTNTSGVVRQMFYDCFGRMVHEIDAPGSAAERGTMFVPNIGFGGDGEGADCAAEVSYNSIGSTRSVLEINQFTYGFGAVGGGLGRKRLVEFLAYGRVDGVAPYYRFLHEDTMGNTVATTSLWGDRLDEYDYTDYGAPLHAPVALDGRWIDSISYSGNHLSTVTLSEVVAAPNELLGCELRVARVDAASPDDVFATAYVTSQNGTNLQLRDYDGRAADVWTDNAGSSASAQAKADAKACANFYDLRQGYWQGVMDDAVNTNWPKSGPFQGLACTIIEVDNGPFENWMVSSTGFDRYVDLYNPQGGPGGTGGWESHWVFDFDDFLQGAGFRKIGISPAVSSSLAGAGKRYIISGDEADGTPREVVQSGEWEEIAQHSYGVTSFSLPSWCYVSPYMTGWTLQPDINVPVYLPILSVNVGTFSGSTVTVSGDYASLASSSSGTFFRIFAPPGTERKGPYVTSQDAGLLSPWVSATSSRYLFGGYRYESPAAGRADPYGGPPIARQSGWNFTGLYYTLNRHYDPFLMRFTSIDPAAAPFYNLYAYCRGNPAAFFDPDGLDINTDATGSSEGDDSEDPMLYRWSHFLFDDYMATGERGEHARNTFNARALNFLTVGTAISDKDVAVFDKLAQSKGHSDVAARSADAFETTKTLSYLIPGPAGTVAFGLDFANRMADGESPNVVDVLFIAAHLPALRNAGRALRAEMAEGRAALKAAEGPMCFVAGTQVAVQGEDGKLGYKNIEEIKSGDQVWSRDEETGQEGFKPVVRLFVNQTTTLVRLSYRRETRSAARETEGVEADDDDGQSLDASTLTGTPEHPFWSITRQAFVGMGALKPGERLLIADGSAATVTTTRTETLSAPVKVYNFEVADWHTYFVAASEDAQPVWVHNLCKLYTQIDEIGRTTGVVARVRPQDVGSGTATNIASRLWARFLGKSSDDAGHLIGRLLGGPGGKNSGNIVPQLTKLNRGKFAKFEREIADRIEKTGTAYLRVIPKYDGLATRPTEFLYRVRFADGRKVTRVFLN